MAGNPAARARGGDSTGFLGWGLRASLAVTLVCSVLLGISLLRGNGDTGIAAPTPATFLVANPRPAPALALTGTTGEPATLAALRGTPVLVFFGYTHCPDVCPATVGNIVEVMNGGGPVVRAVFVTIDPERDTPAFLAEYVRYLPSGFSALTGSATEIRAAADAWGVKYARVETGTPGVYSMSHTADVYLVDAGGTLRARFPFGTTPAAMLATLREMAARYPAASPTGSPATIASVAPTPTSQPTAPPASTGSLTAEIVSSSVWAGGASPVILALSGPSGRLADATLPVEVQLTTTDGAPIGAPAPAIAVRPPGESTVSFIATVDVPSPGWWHLIVTTGGAAPAVTVADIAALDPGQTAALGAQAPTVRTPTLDDVGGDARRVTTDPLPDLRLSRVSTADALATHRPFVLVVDSTRFRTTSACGKAVILARYLADRWPTVTFIHLEPFVYSIVTDTPVLDGVLTDPMLTEPAAAWGIGGSPWGATSMPWVFVVDGNGIVRAKYEGVMGSDDVDLVLSLIEAGG